MNIKQAKQQIKSAMQAYFTKDEFGRYCIPIEKQRPVVLIGPPGIGKTAIMEQIASELGVGLVTYSMTHHTRQSALGLPMIVEREFEGYKYQATEYTMSEIISSIYQLMEETGVREGILFLDEINCVSETLAPSMLQFLQYKVFGQHRIPDGWIVATAGNPPEYNKSVRDFDVVTWDRLKRIDVEPDYEVWKEYALEKGVHPAVMTYLSSRKKDFYKVENTVDGKQFVTARGWDDLSEIIKLYEQKEMPVDELLIGQYLQSPKIAKDFAIYYDLFNKYKSDYQIELILEGKETEDILFRAKRAPMDERVSFMGILFDAIRSELKEVCLQEEFLDVLQPILKEIKQELRSDDAKIAEQLLEEQIVKQETLLETGKQASSLSLQRQGIFYRVIKELNDNRAAVLMRNQTEGVSEMNVIEESFSRRVAELTSMVDSGRNHMEHAFDFCERAFGNDADALLIFVTELTVNYYTARFIGHYGSEGYDTHSKELQLSQRHKEIAQRMKEWNLNS